MALESGAYFDRKVTPALKGIAVIMMFAVHLLKPEWMLHPEWIVDIRLGGEPLSSVIARTGDICIGIFAFITGYGWYGSFHKRTISQRLFKGGIYFSYILVLLLFCLPVRLIDNYISNGVVWTAMPLKNALYSILAIAPVSVKYGWYIFFFSMAVVTYRGSVHLINRLPFQSILKVAVVCIAGFVCRAGVRVLSGAGILSDTWLNVLSHYFQWMPVVMTGSIAKQYGLLEKMDEWINKKIGKRFSVLVAAAMVVLILGIKVFLQKGLNIYSNLDSFYMLPFMYGLIGVAGWICKKCKTGGRMLSFLGDISLYLWLTHCVLMYDPVQMVLFQLRIPLLILSAGLLYMCPIACGLEQLDKKWQQKMLKSK